MTGSGASRIGIDGGDPGAGYDQVEVTGSVSIGSSVSLNATLSAAFVPSTGQTFVLIDNDGSDPVAGTFESLPEGAVITLNQVFEFQISYAGGDGNDVTLTMVSAVKVWSGAVSGLWSAGGNWVGGVVPIAGDELVFPSGVSNGNMTNDLSAGTNFE